MALEMFLLLSKYLTHDIHYFIHVDLPSFCRNMCYTPFPSAARFPILTISITLVPVVPIFSRWYPYQMSLGLHVRCPSVGRHLYGN